MHNKYYCKLNSPRLKYMGVPNQKTYIFKQHSNLKFHAKSKISL